MIEKVYIDKNVKGRDRTEEILEKLKNIPREIIDLDDFVFDHEEKADVVIKSKKNLLLTQHKGRFIKKCPGTKSHLCCNYYVITPIYNCPLDCSYCFLQGHINSPFIKMFVNDENIFYEMDEILGKSSGVQVRFGTGEFSDSLALDEANNFVKRAFNYLKNNENALIELKTKTNNIESLWEIEPLDNLILAWSVSPEALINKEEIGTASLNERIEAAYKCQEYGYKVAFHFDPIINYPSWEEDYKGLVNNIFSKIKPENISWISLGALRYTQETKNIIESRFPESKIIYGELILGLDGKFRYFRSIRENMFERIYGYLKNIDEKMPVYMCMEADFMWKKVYGTVPKCTNVNDLFDNRVLVE